LNKRGAEDQSLSNVLEKMTESHEASYLFKFLLMANMCKFLHLPVFRSFHFHFNFLEQPLDLTGLYLEAGAIPAMLIQISEAFDMSAGLQGILGGIAYLSLGFGSPFAGFLMRNYDHKVVLGYAVGVNSLLTLMWSLTPVGLWYSSSLFIFIRFLMGLMQCVVCVFLPLWTNEFAPATERTKWMGALQVGFLSILFPHFFIAP
jgi:MFS family permease